ncbi:hypothetical protein PYS58_13870 [Chryseobacterium indologenes]|uniref:hypothetical protein n=1 Tax=Chryseobacterium TaxID=59732 RepID=UPI001623F510|nr:MULTISPECIES: hypothetical protein [Chryseobacterium]MDM1554145.1 hypothetical protein [Chryseobacterium indologenes]WET47666.1 hypothetical protein PYS58_13870 [Chryseobacterium indologenes]
MKKLLLLFALALPLSIWAQYLLPNEEIIYSFETKNGKKMTLVKDKKEGYIQYRFGNKNTVEMEFPSTRTKDSWKQFSYRSYMRGGGKQNAGMELNYLSFSNNGYQYQLYKSYYAEDKSYSTGITVTDSKGKETDITGIYKTIKGCLCHLDESTLIVKEDSGL